MTTISLITLIILGVLVLLGLSTSALKDFKIGSITAFVLIALIILTNFIPIITIGVLTFSVGTILFYGFCLTSYVIKGKASNRGIAFLISIILAGILFGAITLATMFGNAYFSNINIVYAIGLGLLALVFTKNAKYAFISSATAILITTIVLQIGGPINLNANFQWAVLASAISVVLYGLLSTAQTRPSRMSYYFEAGRLKDDD